MSFTLRDKKGVMKAVLSDRAGQTLISQGKTFPREAKYEKNGKLVSVPVFEFKEDSYLQVNDELRLYFWEGDVLVSKH